MILLERFLSLKSTAKEASHQAEKWPPELSVLKQTAGSRDIPLAIIGQGLQSSALCLEFAVS